MCIFCKDFQLVAVLKEHLNVFFGRGIENTNLIFIPFNEICIPTKKLEI